MTRALSTLGLLTMLVLSAAHLGGCATWFQSEPTPEEREQAKGKYGVALALIHDAQRLGAAGTSSEADSKWRSALGELQEAEKLDPRNAEVQYLLGMVYFVGFRREEETVKHLDRAIEIRGKEGYPEAEHLMGTALNEFGRPKEALPFLEKARTNLLYQTPYFAQQELGWSHYKLENYDLAVQHLETAIAAQPDLCNAYVRLADVEWSRENPQRVADVLGQFASHCDSDRLRAACGDQLLAYAYYRLGMAQMKLGESEAARTSLSTCIERFGKQKVATECRNTLKIVAP